MNRCEADIKKKDRAMNLNEVEKVSKTLFPSFRRKPESSFFNGFWMPDQVRHDV